MTDDQLMIEAKNGNLEGLKLIFSRHSKSIFNYFKKMTRDHTLSEDLTQDVFEKLIQSRHNYSSKSAFRSWLFIIARNRLMDHYRNIKMQHNRKPEMEVSNPVEENREAEFLEEAKAKLSHSLDQLKPEYREVLLLTRYQNLEYKEAAVILGISENGVKARVFRAMKKLKEIYYNL